MTILHDNWSNGSGENRCDQILKHLAAMLSSAMFGITCAILQVKKLSVQILGHNIFVCKMECLSFVQYEFTDSISYFVCGI